MDIREFIKRKTNLLLEAQIANHFFERLRDRILDKTVVNVGYEDQPGHYKIVGKYRITDDIKNKIKNTYERIINTNFGKNRDVAVKIADIYINPRDVEYNINEYGTDSTELRGKTLVIVDEQTQSNGNSVYAIIRHNTATTLFFGKSYVPVTKEKLDVDILVNKLDNFR